MKLKPVILALASASLGIPNSAQAEIGVGDIAIIRVNNGTDSFSYVSLVNIAGTETIKWTDSSWNTADGGSPSNGWRTTEDSGSGASFTAPSTAGTIGNISTSGFNNGGDQVFLFQGDFLASSTAASAKHKFGVNWDNSGWVTTASSTSNSAQPSSLVINNGSIALGTGDQWYYSGMLSGTSKTLLSAIANPGNWTATTTTASTYDGVRSGAAFSINTGASFAWDSNGTTTGTGGTGTWDSTTANRWSDTANTTFLNNWVNCTTDNDHTAVFGGMAGAVSIASGGISASGLTFNVTGYTIQSNTLGLAGTTPTISVTTAAHSATISSTLVGATGLTKSGDGALNITGTNATNIGATSVAAGTLAVGVSGIGSLTSAVTVSNAGTKLAGSGTITGNVAVNSGAILAPGNSVGILTTVGTTTLNTGSIFEWELSSNVDRNETAPDGTRGTNYDGLTSTNLTVADGAIFRVVLTGTADIASTFWDQTQIWNDIFSVSGTTSDAAVGQLFNAFEVYNGTTNVTLATTSSQGSFSFTGSTLTWTAVPEPSSALAGLLIAAGLLRRRRVA